MRQEHIYSWYGSFKLPFAEEAIVNLRTKIISWTRTCYRVQIGRYVRFTIIKNEFTSQKSAFEPVNAMSETPNCILLYDSVDEFAIMEVQKKHSLIFVKIQNIPFAVPI